MVTARQGSLNDPLKVKDYTLSNGMRLFVSVRKNEPSVFTNIVVRAGSKHDPDDSTGLAHYFEHMMFKGTDRIGSLNWEREKPLLDQIEVLYELHRKEGDPQRKRELYVEIDRLSAEAAQYVAANEYDKIVSAIGAQKTNAYTWVEQTVYVNEIPSNELDRWFELEGERFRRPVLRLFHTELETVYEEFNMSQASDIRKCFHALTSSLMPTHPYGTHTTLGRPEDLKNPSQTNIYRFFDQYYRPNNMAIVLAGDVDPDEAFVLAERHFGAYAPQAIPPFVFERQPELSSRVRRDVYGNESPWIEMAWRLPGAGTPESVLAPLIAGVLYNHQAGLLDLNIVQGQRALQAYAYQYVMEDYSMLHIHAKPREGQSLDDLEQLLLAEIGKLRDGAFAEWLPQAVAADLRLADVLQYQTNQGRVGALANAYILGVEWEEMLRGRESLRLLSREDVAAFARKYIRDDNYAVVYKFQGPDPSVVKVEKPPLTPLQLNRRDESEFARDLLGRKVKPIQPVFPDLSALARGISLSPGVTLRAYPGVDVEGYFKLAWVFDIGKDNDPALSVLAAYFPYLGAGDWDGARMRQELFKAGLQIHANCDNDRFTLTLSGLEESFAQGVAIINRLFTDARADEQALTNLIEDIILRRENEKKDKRVLLTRAMRQYVQYGPDNSFTRRLSEEALRALLPQSLTRLLGELWRYKHDVIYVGALDRRNLVRTLRAELRPAPAQVPAPKPVFFKEKTWRRHQFFFTEFPIVQAELMMVARSAPRFDPEDYILSLWHDQYFGYGLSSIVYQEIRESRALAYSAYAFANRPEYRKRGQYFLTYVATQPDKLPTALETFQSLIDDMPLSQPLMEAARQSVLTQLAIERPSNDQPYWLWRKSRRLGIKGSLNQLIYERLSKASTEDLARYHQSRLRKLKFAYLVIGDPAAIDFNYLNGIGPVTRLAAEKIWGAY